MESMSSSGRHAANRTQFILLTFQPSLIYRPAQFSPRSNAVDGRADLRLADAALCQQLMECWGLDLSDSKFIAVSEPGTAEDEIAAFAVSSEALTAAVAANSPAGVEALVCIGGGNPPGVHNTQNPAPGAMPMSMFKAQFDFNFCASALTVNACIDFVVAAMVMLIKADCLLARSVLACAPGLDCIDLVCEWCNWNR
eukprot:SAG31_NODE_13268_length_881_cov_1.056266_2_plen_197_part_00